MKATDEVCYVCGCQAKYLIWLAGSKDHWHLPNQAVMKQGLPLEEVWFCSSCMLALDEAFCSELARLKAVRKKPE